tara:strand:+ start:7020 stop:7169 length:150 start_codon:yes stop_codon:yes gene_type:complete
MVEMVHGTTTIKVIDQKVEEMIRKGWAVKDQDSGDFAPVDDVDTDSEEE